MTGTLYYHLVSRTMDPCFETKQTYEQDVGKTRCLGCGYPKPEAMVVDVWLQDRAPRDKPLNFVYGLGVVHRELLELIGDDIVQRDLSLGRVTGDGGRQINDWFTFRGRRGVVVRGSRDVRHRTCDTCGRTIYYGGGKQYLYPTPPAGATIYESHLSGLVVPPDVYERVAVKKWRKLGIEKLAVLEQPVDGLGEIPLYAARR